MTRYSLTVQSFHLIPDVLSKKNSIIISLSTICKIYRFAICGICLGSFQKLKYIWCLFHLDTHPDFAMNLGWMEQNSPRQHALSNNTVYIMWLLYSLLCLCVYIFVVEVLYEFRIQFIEQAFKHIHDKWFMENENCDLLCSMNLTYFRMKF